MRAPACEAHFCAMVQGELDPAPWNRWSEITLDMMDAARADMGVVFPADAVSAP